MSEVSNDSVISIDSQGNKKKSIFSRVTGFFGKNKSKRNSDNMNDSILLST